jgi:drug/metabolite transporter (DMT)-like permease
MQSDNKPVWLDWLALILLMLVWGSSFILIKKSLLSFSSWEVGLLRISISFLALLPFVIRSVRKIPKNKLVFFLIAGLIGNGLPPFLFAKAQTVIDSYMAGVLNSLTPLFTLGAGILFFGTRTRWLNVTGVIIGLAGAVGLLSAVNDPLTNNNLWYGLYAVGGAICYAFNMNIIKRFLYGFDALTITSVVFTFVGVPALLLLLTTTGFIHTMQIDPLAWRSLGYLAILAVFGTALAMIIHNWLIRRTSALFAASVTYMMPVVSIMWGIADGESFLLYYLLWITLILTGVYLANRTSRKKPVPDKVPIQRS